MSDSQFQASSGGHRPKHFRAREDAVEKNVAPAGDIQDEPSPQGAPSEPAPQEAPAPAPRDLSGLPSLEDGAGEPAPSDPFATVAATPEALGVTDDDVPAGADDALGTTNGLSQDELADEPLFETVVTPVTDGLAGQEAPAGTGAEGAVAPIPAAEVSPAEDDTKRRRGRRRAGIAGAVVGAGLVAVYVGGGIYFQSNFLPNTTVNGEDVSGMSATALAEEVSSDTSDFSLAVTGDGVDLTVSAEDISFSYDGEKYAEDALAQTNPWAWPVEVFGSRAVVVERAYTYDEDALQRIVSAAVDAANEGATQPVSASIAWSEDSTDWEVMPEQLGTAVDAESVANAVLAAIAAGESEVTLAEEELAQPELTSESDEVQAALQSARELTSLSIKLTIEDEEAATITAEQVHGWVVIADDLSVSLDADAVKTYAQGELSDALDTAGSSRTYTRADGETFTVTGGEYGWVIDGASLAETLVGQIEDGDETAIEVPMKQTAETWSADGQDWGARYVDVDLTEQHARMYDAEGNLVWESDFVSGDPSENNQTPEGVYQINSYMGTDQTLKGLDEDHDGEADYESFVSYWMPFYQNLIAFHDASWRSEFGGTINNGNGSHGCINLPSDKAAELYELVQVGDVVVVHY